MNSKYNNILLICRTERFWVEINTRVNYPVKTALVEMERSSQIDMEHPMHRFCVSWVAIRVCSVGTRLAVEAWINHRVSGTGIIMISFLHVELELTCLLG